MNKAKEFTIINYILTVILFILGIISFVFKKLDLYYSWLILGYFVIILIPLVILFIVFSNYYASKEKNQKLQDLNFITIVINFIIIALIIIHCFTW